MYYSILFPLAAGVLYVIMGIPLWRRSVPRNHAYGFRTKLTLSSDEIWYEVNQRTGKLLFVFGCLLVIFAACYFSFFYGDEASWKRYEFLLIAGLFFFMLTPLAIDFFAYYVKYVKSPNNSESRP